MAPKARQAKGKARLQAYEKLQSEAEAANQSNRARDHDPARPRLGDLVIEAEHLRRASTTGC
jgi:energy-dependent translational throttle protein EttA